MLMDLNYVLRILLLDDSATTVFYTLSLHDALPISSLREHWPILTAFVAVAAGVCWVFSRRRRLLKTDRKSTRLNSSHLGISYAVFFLKKKIDCQMTYLHRVIIVVETAKLCVSASSV